MGFFSLQVIIVKQFDSDVFEALLEFLHVGSCDLGPRLLPGLLSAAQYYQVEGLQQVCIEGMKQRSVSQSSTVSTLSRFLQFILRYVLEQYPLTRVLK